MHITSSTSYAALIQPKALAPINATTDNTSTAAASATTSANSTIPSANSVGTYDFTNMTPNQMQSAAQALYDSGKIDSTQAIRLQLMGMPLGTMQDGQFKPLTAAQRESYGNTPVNYMQLIQSNMVFLQQNGEAGDPKSGYADDQAILGAMQQAQGSVSRVDITA
jgi:hypothetical protein